jgi:hypothetical protein
MYYTNLSNVEWLFLLQEKFCTKPFSCIVRSMHIQKNTSRRSQRKPRILLGNFSKPLVLAKLRGYATRGNQKSNRRDLDLGRIQCARHGHCLKYEVAHSLPPIIARRPFELMEYGVYRSSRLHEYIPAPCNKVAHEM